MMCVSMSDEGMLVLPTHRLFRGLPPMTADQLKAKLGDAFTTEPAGEGPDRALALWEEIEAEGEQGTLGFYTAEDDRWTLARITDAGRGGWPRSPRPLPRLAGPRREHPAPPGRSTRCSTPRSFPPPSTSARSPRSPRALRDGDEAGRDLTGQEGTGGRFELAALVMPATVEHIRAISNAGERMPPKSTYFYPKLLSGLVINPLE